MTAALAVIGFCLFSVTYLTDRFLDQHLPAWKTQRRARLLGHCALIMLTVGATSVAALFAALALRFHDL